ncbi:PEP-CTERM sorting domain-containing protein [Pseudocolwellia sp. HL-MZ19]|uniref:PEP-CTERM sorting domain-containing protein n=1 Tax=unclassified Pseudocolwellia TaxID=2848178 RepID=UPI003CF9464B
MLNTYLKNALLAISLSLFTIGSANANLITQDILFDDLSSTDVLFETIGSITVDTQDGDGDGYINTWVNFELFGFDMITETDAAGNFSLFGLFEAFVDLTNVSAGIEFLTFDVTEDSSSFFNFQGLADTAFTGGNFIDVFDSSGNVFIFGELALGQASVVPEPSMFLLFFTGLFFLVAKRRKN